MANNRKQTQRAAAHGRIPGSMNGEIRRRIAAQNAAHMGETSMPDKVIPEGPRPEERLYVPKAAPPKTAVKPAVQGLDLKGLRRAVILSEILSPPLSRRGRR